MKVIDFFEHFDERSVICLGYFDCLHIGHAAIIRRGAELAERQGAKLAAFTFYDGKSGSDTLERSVLTFSERIKKMERSGVEIVIAASFDDKFKHISAEDFLAHLSSYNLTGVVCGFDYSFGAERRGTPQMLKDFFEGKTAVEVVDEFRYENEKVSTTRIKRLLSQGDVSDAAVLLGEPYSISGAVCEGRHVGSKLGFPTANIDFPSNKYPPREGVYKTHVLIGGKRYECITNYSGCPTFGVNKVLVETHIIGFVGDLYGSLLEVHFDRFMRESRRFDSVEALREQLTKDVAEALLK